MFKKAAAFILITAFAALPLAAQEQTPAQQRYSAMLRQGQNTATPLNSKQQYKYKTPPPSKAAPIKLATPAKKTTAKDESVYLEEDRPTRPFEILGGDAEKAKQKRMRCLKVT